MKSSGGWSVQHERLVLSGEAGKTNAFSEVSKGLNGSLIQLLLEFRSATTADAPRVGIEGESRDIYR